MISPEEARTLVYISKCEDCNYTIVKKATKVVIDACTNTTIHLKTSLITGYLEVINSKNVTVQLDEQIPTITVDITNGCKLEFKDILCMRDVYTAKCNDVTICFKEGSQQEYLVPVDLELVKREEWEANQCIPFEINRFYRHSCVSQ
jgi:hypothetical protein